DDEVAHALPFPEAGQQLIGPPGNRLTAGEQATTRTGSGIADHVADGLADDLSLGHTPLGCRPLDGGLEVVGQIERRLLHTHMVPPVAMVLVRPGSVLKCTTWAPTGLSTRG